MCHNVTPFFSKNFQIENQNFPIDLDPILNNLGDLLGHRWSKSNSNIQN